MATLVVHAEGAAPSFVPLVKPLTTLAAAADSDVRVPDLRGVVAIQFDGESFIATALEGAHLVVNGKRRGQHTLADGDTMELGGTQLVFQSGERIQPPVALRRDDLSGPELATSRLAQFARQLANEPGVDSALGRLLDELRADKKALLDRLDEHAYGDIIGACDAMRDIFRKIDKVAGTDISVLVTGETGTGKELIAREIHRRGPRKNGPFVAINCGAIPENLLESELFGHAKGAFTGAVAARPGRFQAASGGTLFLDEIGEMPVALQVKLLRALQERAVTRVGENKPEAVDIRVVAATNKDLDEEMKAGRFREDLYYRINVVHLHLPALRDRGEDAAMLAKWFLGRAVRELGSKVKGFSPQALVAIKRYRWPGNIRQLENRIKKAVVLADRPLISPDDLELRPEQLEPILPLAEARDEWQKRYINEVLERNGGNRTKTAKDLGVDPRTIFRHLERMEAEKRGETLPPDDSLDEQ